MSAPRRSVHIRTWKHLLLVGLSTSLIYSDLEPFVTAYPSVSMRKLKSQGLTHYQNSEGIMLPFIIKTQVRKQQRKGKLGALF